MRLSLSGAAADVPKIPENSKDIVGYSNAASNVMRVFENNGFECLIQTDKAPVAIGFGYPTDYYFNPHQYKIGYTAWESTKLKPEWYEIMGKCDDIWATSSWTARVFKKQLGRDIHVYPHGINLDWAPYKREVQDVFRFLHIGEPQLRKNGQLVVEAFIETFGKDPKYQLILKTGGINTTRIYSLDGSIIGGPDSHYPNITIINENLTHNQMIELYNRCHALVYPSSGEGFGFIPLQALATGMPAISTWQWAEYKEFITIKLESHLEETIHDELHPGLTYHVDKENIKKSMVDVVENYNVYHEKTLINSPIIHKKFNWETVSKTTVSRLKNIFETRGF